MTVDKEDMIDFKMNIDPNMKSDTVVEHENGKDFTYEDIKNYFPLKKQEPIKCLVYWDDICQFTSIGLIELLNRICKTNAKIDIKHFLNRPNDYMYGINYVIKIFEKVLTKEQILKFRKEFYWEIMTMSLKSDLFIGLTKMDTYFDKLGFFFPYHFKHEGDLKTDLKKIFFNKFVEEKIFFYYGEDGVSFNGLLDNKQFNSIITPSVTDTYEYILDNKIKAISIIAPDSHNGITEELYKMFCNYRYFPRPNNCKISLYEEFPVL